MTITGKISCLTILSLCTFCSCRKAIVPKPEGYFRIDLPAREYRIYDDHPSQTRMIPFSFEFPVYGYISFDVENDAEPGWFNIEFPRYKATIYLTYKEIRDNLGSLVEEAYQMNVKNHIVKADAINEQIIYNTEHETYGILYDLKGNTATSVQFYVTDSVRHYLRGSLYFDAAPNADSLAPVIEFFREDILHLIETLRWK